MKITYVVREHSHGGGTDRVLSRKANYLVSHGFDVSIITSENSDVIPFFFYDERIKFHYLNIVDRKENKEIYLDKLTNCLKTNKTDISIATGLGLTQYLCEVEDDSLKILEFHFSKYKGKSFFAKWDRYSIGRFISSIYSKDQTRRANRFDRFVVLTQEDKELWRGVENISVIPNPITIEVEEGEQSALTSKRVIAVGRYTGQKGFDRLVRIWKQMKDLHPDWKLSIFGDGKYKTRLEKYIEKHKLGLQVELLPPTKNIKYEFLTSSIFVMTSRYEGQPLVLIEAMAMGLPAVAYSFKSGAKETIANGIDGFIVEEGDHKDFIEKVSLLMRDQDLRSRMGNNASINITRFLEENIMPKWVALFESLLSSKQ